MKNKEKMLITEGLRMYVDGLKNIKAKERRGKLGKGLSS